MRSNILPLALGLGIAVNLLVFVAPGDARTWRIRPDANGDATTIQAGIDSSVAGDTVLVDPGVYLENLALEKDITLLSSSGPDLTTLDGSGQSAPVIHVNTSTRSTVIRGFRITGGTGNPRGMVADGGGIFLEANAAPSIIDNYFVSNGVRGVTEYGGAIGSFGLKIRPLIEGNIFADNTARLGGAVAINSGSATIHSNTFINNLAQADGGAIFLGVNSGATFVTSNHFNMNSAWDHGGAVYAGAVGLNPTASLLLKWNLFIHNDAGGNGVGDSGGGGAVHLIQIPGEISLNTLVGNKSYGEGVCNGSAISLDRTTPELAITGNLIALNESCAVACRNDAGTAFGQNLFWTNQGGDIGPNCPNDWISNQVQADPNFCDPDADKYTVSVNSPALSGPMLFGAFLSPGCGPVAVIPITWGRLKTLYQE